jgi:hypothetical protein
MATFLAAWVGIWRFVFHDPNTGLTATPGGWNPRLICTFAFPLPDGRVVETSDDLVMNDRLGACPTEPVLYDPTVCTRALLLNGLVPPVRVGTDGAWESAEEVPLLRRLVVAVLCPLAGPLLAWVAWTV